MQILSFGYKKPEPGDNGSPVFEAINGNTDKVNAHRHNGTDSHKILSTDIDKPVLTLAAAGWTTVSNGYKQTATCPGTVTLDKVILRFRVKSGTHQHKFINPTVIPLSLTQFEVVVNVPSLELEVLFI